MAARAAEEPSGQAAKRWRGHGGGDAEHGVGCSSSSSNLPDPLSLPPEPIILKKDPSRNRVGGAMYEVRVAALLNARLRALCVKHSHSRLQYFLYSNVVGTRPFDDIVLHLRWADGCSERKLTYFLQLKLRENLSGKKSTIDILQNDKFDVTDAHKQFNKSVKTLREKNENELSDSQRVLREWLDGEYLLIVFTSWEVSLHNLETLGSQVTSYFEEHVFLTTNEHSVFSISHIKHDCWKWENNDNLLLESIFKLQSCFQESDTPTAQEESTFSADDRAHSRSKETQGISKGEFLQRLRIFHKQLHQKDLTPLLQMALQELLRCSTNTARLLLEPYLLNCFEWWDADVGTGLSLDSSEIEEAVRDVIHSNLQLLNFQKKYSTNLAETIKDCRTACIHVQGVHQQMRCSLLKPALEEAHAGRYVILTPECFDEYSLGILNTLCLKLCEVLVLSADHLNEKMCLFMKDLKDLKLFIVLGRECLSKNLCGFVKHLECQERLIALPKDHGTMWAWVKSLDIHCYTGPEKWNLTEMETAEQKMLLRKDIHFQDHVLPLRQLVDLCPDAKDWVAGADLAALAMDVGVQVGAPLPPSQNALYVPRKLRLSNSLSCSQPTQLNEEDVSYSDAINHEVNAISSVPGMGKTVFLIHVAHDLKKDKSLRWVIFLNISEGKLIDEIPTDVEDKHVIRLLCRAALSNTSSEELTRKILEWYICNKLGVCVLVDGVDEVRAEHREKVRGVLERLRAMNLERLWVASRPAAEEDLARALRCQPLLLSPLSFEEQCDFVRRRWGAADGEMKQRVISFVDILNKVLPEAEGIGIARTPLYLYILAEIYSRQESLSNVEYFQRTGRTFVKLNIIQSFVQMNEKIHYKNSIAAFVSDIHTASALYVLFSPDILQQFYDETERLVNNLADYFEKQCEALILKIVDGKPVFAHRVFAEYFAALSLTTKYRDLRAAMEAVYFSSKFAQVREFFDALLAEGSPLHQAALGDNLEAVEEVLRQGQDVDAKDAGGRTALHLAAICGHERIVTLLTDRGASVTVVDGVKTWTALRYADAILGTTDAEHSRVCTQLAVVEQLLRAGASAADAPRALALLRKSSPSQQQAIRQRCPFLVAAIDQPLLQRNTAFRFQKEVARVRMSGIFYEMQMAGLICSRLRAWRRRFRDLDLRFRLASNVMGTRPFDDLVLQLRWLHQGSERQMTYFVELKYNENINICITAKDLAGSGLKNKSFNLERYYEIFIRTKDSTRTPEEIRNLLKGDYRLVLLTTRPVLPKASRASSPLDFPFEEVFHTGQGEAFSFGDSNPKIVQSYEKIPRDFFQRLRIFSTQAKVSALEPLLKSSLEQALGTPLPRPDTFLALYRNFLQQWWDSDEGDCLTEDTSEIEEMARKLNSTE